MPAKETTKRRSDAANRDVESPDGIQLFYPILVDCGLDRTDFSEARDEKPERFYDSAIRPVPQSTDEKLSLAICEFSAGQKIKDVNVLEIHASYMIALHHEAGRAFSDAARRRMLEQTIKISAWPLFRDLFIHIGSQTGAELPLLPNTPKLRWLQPKDQSDEEEKPVAK